MLNVELFQNLSAGEIELRVTSAVFCGTLIGTERMWRHKEAGLKTNALVCLGAAIFGIVSTNSYAVPNWAASQFSAGVLTGVGFLGSGIMLKQSDQHVQGVNSAATIWVSAGVGLACGMGEYGLAIISLVAVLVVQVLHRWVEGKVRPPKA